MIFHIIKVKKEGETPSIPYEGRHPGFRMRDHPLALFRTGKKIRLTYTGKCQGAARSRRAMPGAIGRPAQTRQMRL